MKLTSATPAAGQNAAFDLARGLAALAVLANHLRGFVFLNWEEAGNPGALWAGYYFITSLGHQAVIVFFVLSGYFISSSVARAAGAGRFDYLEYAAKRLARLWVVLLPALLLTMVWDQLGMRLSSGAFYSGAYAGTFFSGPIASDASEAYAPATLLANVFFLQTITVPPFGSNGPLWSLANEFWYYVLFPLVFIGLRSGASLVSRAMQLALSIGLLVWLPPEIALYGLVWLMGFGVHLASQRLQRSPVARGLAIWVGAVGFGVLLAAPRLLHTSGWPMDFVLAAAFALWMSGIGSSPHSGKTLPGADLLARASYTLYLTHFPFIAFICAIAFDGRRYLPGVEGALAYAGILILALAYAWSVYWLFERRTAAVQFILANALRRGRVRLR